MKKNHYKQILSMLIVAVMLLSMAGCGSVERVEKAGSTSAGSEAAKTADRSDGEKADEADTVKDSQKDSGEETGQLGAGTFTDDCDRTVEVPTKIKNVIASGNLAQIFVFAIAPDTLMAINGAWTEDAAKYVDQKYLDLPEVGSFFGKHDLNYEEIAKLSPDIVIDVGEKKPSMKADLDD